MYLEQYWPLFSIIILSPTYVQCEDLFGVDSGNNDGSSTLLKIDMTSGASTIVGETGVYEITDIAFSSDGNLYE